MSGLTVEQLSQEELVKLIDAVQHGLACAYEDRIVIALKMALAALSERGGEAVAYRYRMHPNFHWTLSYRFPVVPNNVEVQPLYTCPQAGQVSENAAQELADRLEQLRAENATLRAAQKACEHCDSCIAAVVEERAREIAEAMPSGMLEMSNADYWTTQINAAITLAVQQERDRCMAECEQLRRDAERYLKLRHLLIDANGVLHAALNFKGFIEIGEREIDAAIDAASAEGER